MIAFDPAARPAEPQADAKALLAAAVATARDEILALSHAIHEHPEPAYEEHRAAAWVAEAIAYVTGGDFNRDTNYIEDRITRDGTPGPNGEPGWPVEPGRYRLVAARACPWANRTIIVRRLLGLEDAISPRPSRPHPRCPVAGPSTWIRDGVDPVLGIERLQDAYFAAFPDYPRGITVPAIVDVASGEVVTNNFPQITLDFSTEWTEFHRAGAPDLYPDHLREEIDEVNKRVFTEVNNGVYRCGFAGSQEAYDAAYDRLWTALDWLEERLAGQRYLVGDTITEADVRLFTTLARFDAVYHGHFKCNRQQAQPKCRCCGAMRGTCSRRRASATPPTSCRSSSTITSCTRTSTPPRSCPRARTSPAG